MNRLNKKLTTFILAGVCAASLSVATANVITSADEAKMYNITSVFSKSSNATIASKNVNDKETIAFTLGNDENIRLKRDLAFAWYEGKNDAKYFNMKFVFDNLDFESVTFTVETDTSEANEDDKAVNAVEFSVESGKVYATVINGEARGDKKETSIVAGSDVVLALGKTEMTKFDEFEVLVNDENVGTFTKVGANYAEYGTNDPLEISAKAEEEKTAVILLKEINGQSFENVTKSDDETPTYSVTDTAAPVLVLNDELDAFQYGTQYALTSYKKIDVLQSSSLTETIKYYQWNPADSEATYISMPSSKPYLMDSVYYTNAAGDKLSKSKTDECTIATSVYLEEGAEYISVQYTLSDDSNTEGKTYDLAWYVDAEDIATKKLGEAETDYVKILSKTSGATYTIISTENGTNEKTANYDEVVDAYQKRLDTAAKGAKEGDSEKVTIPDVAALIEDEDDSYRALKFTICYKTPAADGTKSSSSLSYNSLSISTTKAGAYEFKIFANDKTGNTMKYYLDGELVSVSTSNIWDIEEIPTFYFEVEDAVIQVKDTESDRKAEKTLDQTYTLSSVSIIGAENSVSEYGLYRFDSKAYKGETILDSKFTGIKYETIRQAAVEKIDQVGEGKMYASYFDLYLTIYAEQLAKAVDSDATQADIDHLKSCFKEVKPYNANITEDDAEWEEYNKYNWNATSKSFTTAEEGEYLLLVDVSEKDNPMQRAVGYKLVFVNSKADVIKGTSQFATWVKNNIVSVILFGVAGLLLIAIIVLLFIKPSDETLEDVEAKAEKKKAKKAKKEKTEESGKADVE